MGLRVDRIEDEEGLRALKADWDSLLRDSPSNNLFLTWEWVHTWWQFYGHESRLHILIARDERGVLRGIAPLKRVRRSLLGLASVQQLEFLGHGGDVVPDQLDIICAKGQEDGILASFVRHIAMDPEVNGLDLRPFSGESHNLSLLARYLQAESGSLEVVPDSVCPVLPLPASCEAFLAGRSRNYRKKLREYERRSERELGVRLRRSVTPEELRRDMRSLVDLHRKRWAGASRAFVTDQYVGFHERVSDLALARDWLRLYSLETDSKAIAHLYCFSYHGRFYYCQSGWDPEYARHRVGLVLMHRVILEAIKEGATVFDFLRGHEAYKYRWSATEVHNLRLVHWKKPASRMIAALTGVFDLRRAAISKSPDRDEATPDADG